MIYNNTVNNDTALSVCLSIPPSGCLSLTRDFVFQFHVGHFAPRRQPHSPRPIGGVQLPIGGPGTQTRGGGQRSERDEGEAGD